MEKNVGCYIKNEFKFSDLPVQHEFTPASAIRCAQHCFQSNSSCGEGWSYQIATKRCIFYNKIDVEKLGPKVALSVSNTSLGWITGFKSCNRSGMYCALNFFHLRIISDVDGEWGRWKSEESTYQDDNNETKVCFQRKRECDKPSPCGENAKDCDGDAIDSGNCPSSSTLKIYKLNS